MTVAEPLLLPGFRGTRLPTWVRDRLRDGLGGVCLFADNIAASPAALQELTAEVREANPSALVAVDEEGGDVTRLHAAAGSPFPGNAVLGRLDDLAATDAVARTVARQLRDSGCTLNLAPCLDVCSHPDPVIGVRGFGASADLVARHGAAWVTAHQSEGVAACAKHFPGHGDTSVDSHVALPVVDRSLAELSARELVPFAAAVDAGCWAVMTAHLVLPRLDPAQPVTFSAPVLDGLLRQRLGFTGAIVTDALDMAGAGGSLAAAAVRAVGAGCDLLCLGSYSTEREVAAVTAAIDAAARRGALAPSRVAGAARRVSELAARVQAAATRAAVTAAPPAGVVPGATRLRATFEVSPRASRSLPRPGPRTLVQLVAAPEFAAGATPWGPLAALAGSPPPPGLRVITADAATRADDLPAGDLVLVGRSNHRHPWVRELVEACRARSADVLIVDMGWPDGGRGYADVATYGGSRLVGEALLELIGPAGR